MQTMAADAIRLLLFPALMAFAASSDLLTMTISNRLSIALAAGFSLLALVTGMDLYAIGMHLAAAAIMLAVAFVFFSQGFDLDGVKSVCMALQQSERYGTPLATMLRVMAQENRDMRMSEAEKKAAGLPPKLTVPMILFFLPVLYIVILGPAAIKVMALR